MRYFVRSSFPNDGTSGAWMPTRSSVLPLIAGGYPPHRRGRALPHATSALIRAEDVARHPHSLRPAKQKEAGNPLLLRHGQKLRCVNPPAPASSSKRKESCLDKEFPT